MAVITYTVLSDGEASAWRYANLEGKKRIESSGDFKVNSSLKNCTFFKSHTITPDRSFSGTLKCRREVTEIP